MKRVLYLVIFSLFLLLNAFLIWACADDYYEFFIKDCRDAFPFGYCPWGSESMVAVADRRSDFVNKILEYENTQIDNNAVRINAYGVNQEKLDMYRAAHPRYNFPKNIKDLNEKQAKQILSYFWDNYRFSDYKYDEIQEKVWDMMIHISMSDLEKQINECIRKYYKFDAGFYAPFGSVASVSLLNGMAPKHIPDFYLILNEVKY